MEKYVKCDKYYLVLISDAALSNEYMFPLLEYYCNKYNKTDCKNKWNNIYIF